MKLIWLSLLLVLLAFVPALTGKIFLNGDTTTFYYPVFSFYQNYIQPTGSVPLWNSDMLGGFPLYVDLVGGFFNPINFFIFKQHISSFLAYNIETLFYLILLFVATYFLSKELGVSKIGSLISATLLFFAQWVLNWGVTLPMSSTFFILPVLFLAALKIKKGRYWWGLLAAAAIWVGLIGGHYQTLFYILVASGIWNLWIIFTEKQEDFLIKEKILKFVITCTSFLAGFIAALPWLMPVYKMLALTERSAGLTQTSISSGGGLYILDFVHFVFPGISLPLAGLFSSESFLYFGASALLIILVGLPYLKTNKAVKFFLIGFLIIIFLIINKSPLYWIIQKLPFFNLFRISERWIFIGSFFGAMITGLSFDALQDKFLDNFVVRAGKICLWFCMLTAAFLMVFNLSNYFFDSQIINFILDVFEKKIYNSASYALPLQHYKEYLVILFNNFVSSFKFNNVQLIVPLASLILSGLILQNNKNQIINAKKSVLLFFIIVLEVFFVGRSFIVYTEAKSLTTIPQSYIDLKAVDSDFQKFKIYSLLPEFNSWTKLSSKDAPDNLVIDFKKNAMLTNMNLLYGVPSLDGYSNFATDRQRVMLGKFYSERTSIFNRELVKDGGYENILKDFAQKAYVLGILNVKYIFSPQEIFSDQLELINKSKTLSEQNIFIYKEKKFNKKFYWADKIHFVGNSQEALLKIFDPSFKIGEAIIECKNLCFQSQNEPVHVQSDTIQILKDYHGDILLKVQNSTERWLVFSESYIPGWIAKIDGIKTNIYPANYLFQGIKILPGSHEVRLIYEGL